MILNNITGEVEVAVEMTSSSKERNDSISVEQGRQEEEWLDWLPNVELSSTCKDGKQIGIGNTSHSDEFICPKVLASSSICDNQTYKRAKISSSLRLIIKDFKMKSRSVPVARSVSDLDLLNMPFSFHC
jgi:hypothetical protein